MPSDVNSAIALMETLADRLLVLQARLRQHATWLRELPTGSPPDGYTVPGGMTDRVQMNVVGPDGAMKQQVDTGR